MHHCRTELAGKIDRSAFVMSLVPGGEPDIKFAVELGLAILANKPIVAVAMAGRTIPPGLERVAHSVIKLERDFDTEAGADEFRAAYEEVCGALGL